MTTSSSMRAMSQMLSVVSAAMLLLSLAAMLMSTPVHAQTITDITNSQRTVGSLSPNSASYFSANCTSPGNTIVVVVTALYGEPNIYWSRSNMYPNPQNNDGSSTQDGSDVISISNCALGNYYVAVVADDVYASSFTIQAQVYNPQNPQNSPRTLLTTMPQNDLLGGNTWRYFTLQLTSASSMLNLYLASRVGDPDLYVLYSATNNIASFYPTTTRYNWSSTAWGSDLLAIPNAAAGYYFIGIYAYTDVAYQISAAVLEQPLAMIDGYTYGRQVQQDTYVYYTFTVPATTTTTDLFFITTAMSGDPDIYVSRTYQRPNRTHYEWRSSSVTAIDVIVLYGALNEVQAGTYYIGVHGWSTARFTIMTSLQVRANLIAGSATAGALAANGYRIYQLDVPINTAVDWTVTTVATYGYTTLYLGKNPRIDPDDTTTYTYTSTWLSATTQNINVPGTYCTTPISNVTNACRMYILARAPYQPSGYQIIAASTNSYTTLIPSQPTVLSTVSAGQYRFYRFNVALLYANVSIQVTANAGNPDLFVGRVAPVNAGNAMFQSTAVGTDRVTFWWNDPRLEGQSLTGNWYVAVYGTTAATFTVLVTVNDTSAAVRPVTLPLGTIQRAVVAAQATNVYRLTLSRVNGTFPTLYVSVTPVSGDPDLTIVNELTGLSVTSAQAGQEIITIAPTSPVACTATNTTCIFSIRVYGWSRSDYVIVGSTAGSLSIVSNRVATVSNVPSRGWTYYMFVNPSASSNTQMELALSMTQLFGNPDLYVSGTFPPSQTNYQWSSANSVGGDFVTISPVALQYYYIGVYANSATLASFSLYSDLYNKSAPELTPVAMSLGNPVQGAGSARNFRYYTLNLFANPMPRYLMISLLALVGDPDLYVTTTQLDGNVWPSLTYSRWSATAGGSDLIYILSPNATTYRIGVYTWSTTLYQLTVSTASTRPLSDGIALNGVATPASPSYFSFNLAQLVVNASLQFSVTPSTGNPDIFVSRSLSELEAGRFTWSSTQSSGVDLVRIPASQVQTGTYYVRVNTTSSSTSFTILASFSAPITLFDGLSTSTYVSTSQSQYYRVSYQGPLSGAVTIAVTPYWGMPFLYVNTRAGVEPTIYSSDLNDTTPVEGPHSVTIPTSRCNTATVCTFNILVFASTGTYFTISSSTPSTFKVLSPTASESGSLTTGAASFYRFTVPSRYSNVTLLLRALTGNPDLYVGLTRTVSPQEWYWASTNSSAFGIDMVYFDWTSPYLPSLMTSYTFYVAVYARTQTTFTLTLSVTDSTAPQTRRALTANVEQAGSVVQGAYDLYSFTVSSASSRSAVSFYLYSLQADSDIYVTCPETGGSWQSLAGGTETDVVSLTPGTAGVCTRNTTDNRPCLYHIDVYGYRATTYVIVARLALAEVRLLPGGVQTITNLRPGSWSNFMFADADPSSAKRLSFIVTPIAGNPDLYVSTIGRPTTSSYNWSSVTANEEYVLVGAATVRLYWVAVRSAGTTNASFSIMADYFDQQNPQGSAVSLTTGSLLNGLLDRYEWRYYLYATNAGYTHVSFAVFAVSGNPDLYVSAQGLSGTGFPTASRYDFSSQNAGTDVIVVPRTVADTYRIGVVGSSRTFFAVVAAVARVQALPARNSVLLMNYDNDWYTVYALNVTGTSFSITLNTNATVGIAMSQMTVLPRSTIDERIVKRSDVASGANRVITMTGLTRGQLFISIWYSAAPLARVTIVDYSSSSVASSSAAPIAPSSVPRPSSAAVPVVASSSAAVPVVASSSAAVPVVASSSAAPPVAASSAPLPSSAAPPVVASSAAPPVVASSAAPPVVASSAVPPIVASSVPALSSSVTRPIVASSTGAAIEAPAESSGSNATVIIAVVIPLVVVVLVVGVLLYRRRSAVSRPTSSLDEGMLEMNSYGRKGKKGGGSTRLLDESDPEGHERSDSSSYRPVQFRYQ